MRISFLVASVLLSAPVSADVTVTNPTELLAAVDAANRGGDPTILLQDGTYVLATTLVIRGNGITIRGQRGARDAVSVFGLGMQGSVRVLILVQGSGFTLRDLTLGRVNAHAVQVQGEQNSSQVVLRNLRIQDCFEQMVKISYLATSPNRSRDGVLENCLLEYTAGIGPQFYIGGIDGHFTKDWVVRGNTFRNIQSPGGALAEHAIHFWSLAEGTVVEGNRIVDCDRGIGFGLGDRGHVGGAIRNNTIWHGSQTTPFADVGIGLENASNVEVAHNTVVFANAYPNAIEYRFAGTQGGRIANNLCNKAIAARDGASASLQGNLTSASPAWFTAPAQGDLHLLTAVAAVVDRGVAVPGVDRDLDGQPRPLGAGVDLGADEWVALLASHDAYGSGCAGSAGEPTVRATQLPWLGHPFELQVDDLAASRGAVLLLGTSRTAWGAVPLPLDLGPIGMPGCALRTSIQTAAALAVQNGAAVFGAMIPADAALLGGRFVDQVLSLEPGANAFGAVVSAGGEARIGG